MPTESVKNDRQDNKVMMDLLPWAELEEIGKVYTAGAKKYGPNRWQNLPNGYERYKGAMLRHLTEVEKVIFLTMIQVACTQRKWLGMQ